MKIKKGNTLVLEFKQPMPGLFQNGVATVEKLNADGVHFLVNFKRSPNSPQGHSLILSTKDFGKQYVIQSVY